MAAVTQPALDGAPRTTCDACGRWIDTYRVDEPGRLPVGSGYTPYRAVPHTGRRGGCYAGTRQCVMSDRETSHLSLVVAAQDGGA